MEDNYGTNYGTGNNSTTYGTGSKGTTYGTNNNGVSYATNNSAVNGLPTQVSIWTKVRNFLFQEVEITLTPKQEKIVKGISDFWNQEITGQKVHDFLFYEITGEKVKNFLFKEIEIVDNIEL